MGTRMTSRQHKALYQAMKSAARARKIKLSAQHDLYKKESPYFYHAFWWPEEFASGRIGMSLDITVKYHRFDELQYGILRPDEQPHFTDKLRANSGMLCDASFPRMIRHFDFDGTDAAMPGLCEDLLDFLQDYCAEFLTMVEETYGDLDGYYIANRETMPRLAGLAFLDRGDAAGAAECFSQPNMDGENSTWWVRVETEEQRQRALASGTYLYECPEYTAVHRHRRDQFWDYATALKNGLEWTPDRAMFGLLPEERRAAAPGR